MSLLASNLLHLSTIQLLNTQRLWYLHDLQGEVSDSRADKSVSKSNALNPHEGSSLFIGDIFDSVGDDPDLGGDIPVKK